MCCYCFISKELPLQREKNKCRTGVYTNVLCGGFCFVFNEYLRKILKLQQAKIGDKSLTPPFSPKARAIKRNEHFFVTDLEGRGLFHASGDRCSFPIGEGARAFHEDQGREDGVDAAPVE